MDNKRHRKDLLITSYEMVVNYLLRMYETDVIIENNNFEINRSKQGKILSPLVCAVFVDQSAEMRHFVL